MSRKQSLAKKIAHTLMAMSIVYSSGINIVVNQVYAAETKNLTNSDSTFSKVGTGGNNYYQPGGVTDGESVVFTGTVTENITNDIVVDIKGGKGGADDNYPAGKPTVDGGAKGGSAIAKITIDESLSDITLNNIKISVYGAEQGMSVYGTSNVGGAAEAYGLQVKHDLKITAADITVDAKSNSSIRQNIGDFKKPDTIAVGLQVEGSKVDFTGAGISLSAKANNNQSDNQTDYLPGNYDGGDVEAYGIRSSGSETTAKLTGTIKFSEVKGGNGDKRGYIDADSGIGAGRGGNVTAYGVEVNGGTAHLDLQNIETSNDNSLSGGSGGLGAGGSMSTVTTAVAGGSGGMVTAAGVHIAGGMADGNIGNITMIGSGGAGGTGGYGSSTSGVAGIGAAGGVGGDAVIAGIDAEAGQTNLTVAKVNIKAAGGIGGMGGHTSSGNISGMGGTGGIAYAHGVRGSDASNMQVKTADISVSGNGGAGGNGSFSRDNICGAGGTGGTAYAHGVLGSGASNMQVKTADISVSGIGGAGGNGGEYNDVICGAGGTGGAAEAYGISAINSVVDIDAGNIQTTASGGKGGNGGSAKISGTSGKGGKGGNGGMLTAAGVRIAGGKADGNIGDITMIGSGGDGGAGGSDNYGGSTNRAGIGAAGGVGGDAVMAGIDAEAGQTDLTVTEVNIKTTGGIGGIGSLSDTATSGAGGTGGTAYAHGVRGSSASMMQIKTADISVSGIGGAGGTGGTSNTGTSGIGGTGGNTYAYGVLGSAASSMQVKAADIIVSGIGGAGGVGGSNYANSVLGGNGGAAEAYGIRAINSVVDIDAANIQTTATGGKGGTGGYGGQFNNKGDGGDGGDGGNAYAYGVQSSGGTVTAATDKITATASGGMAGDAGSGSNGGVDGTAGSIAAEAKAYGIYAEQNAVINLHAKSTGTIKIGAKAENATNTEAYAVYADKATVIFHDNAELNTSDGSIEDNNVLTYLKDATLGFGGTTADRIVTGGTLKLEGSNTFRFTTNLANNQADSMTFDTIENNSSKQYIQIGYEEAFKDALSEADIVTITGNANVLTINNLNGQNLNNFTGQASSLDSPLERFKVTPTVDVVDNKVNITEIALAKENSPSETAMAASDAQMAMGSMWRIEGNNLMKRMGELRSDKEAAQGGVWARYYRGELSADSAYDRNYSQDYTAFQGGIDKVQDYKGGKLYTGIAVNRIDSNAGYTAGSGDLSSTGVGLYASWLGSKGHYVDVIARGSKLANDFKLVDLSGNAAKADYDTWAYGISAEYGYRQNLNAGWFVEPQAELSLGRIGSVDYTTSNDVTIKQDSVNSAVVRLGFLGGKEFTIGGRTSNAYVKASALHDFGGDGGATGYYENTSLALQTGDLMGTWYEIGLGANLGIAKNSNLYFDALKTFGGNLRTDWQFNAGLRFSF